MAVVKTVYVDGQRREVVDTSDLLKLIDLKLWEVVVDTPSYLKIEAANNKRVTDLLNQQAQTFATNEAQRDAKVDAKVESISELQGKIGAVYENTSDCSATKNYNVEFFVNIPEGEKFSVTLYGDAVFTSANVFYNGTSLEIGRVNVDEVAKEFVAPVDIQKIVVFRSKNYISASGTVRAKLDVKGSLTSTIINISDNADLALANSRDFNVYEETDGQGQYTNKYKCFFKKGTIIQLRNEQESTQITRLRTYGKDATTVINNISTKINQGDFVNFTLDTDDVYYYELYIAGSDTKVLKYSIVEIGSINELISKNDRDIDIINCYYTYNEILKSVNHMGHKSCPENTIVAIKTSRANGFKYVENDVRFTSDGVPVMIHDETINKTARNADGTMLTTDVYIADITLAQAKSYDFGLYKGEKFRGEKIPTLEEYLLTCKNIGLSPYLEIKIDNEAQGVEIAKIAYRYGFRGNITFISFNYNILDAISNFDNKARIGYLLNVVNQDRINEIKLLKDKGNEVFADVYKSSVDEATINLLSENRIELEIWVVDDNSGSIEYIKNLDPYITGVTTNRWVVGKIISEY